MHSVSGYMLCFAKIGIIGYDLSPRISSRDFSPKSSPLLVPMLVYIRRIDVGMRLSQVRHQRRGNYM